MSAPPTLSPIVPLLSLGLLLLTFTWLSSILLVLRPSPLPTTSTNNSETGKGKKKKQDASTPEVAIVSPNVPDLTSAYKRVFLLALCWIAMLVLLVSGQFSFAEDISVFDPYRILNVTSEATKSEVKRVFRTLSMDFHPDRMGGKTPEEKIQAEEKFILISKAYKTLTDDEAMKNYLEYGHPDGPRSNSISFGIPAWMLEKENENLVIVGYLAFFALIGFSIAKYAAPLLQNLGGGEEEVPVPLVSPAAAAAKQKRGKRE